MDSQIKTGGKFKMANNFVSNDNATDLMNAINQKKDTKPDTITWDEWIALTDEQREGTHYIITNVPASFSSKDAVFALRNVTLEFTNKTAVITDARVTSDAYLFTFFYDEAVAQAAGIECTWGNGTITFTVEENPTSDIVLDILAILPALSPGGSDPVQSDWNQTDNTALDYIKNKPSLSTVATSGDYEDLSNKPTIPAVNNATLTIQKNGNTVKTFTANASSDVTCNITCLTDHQSLAPIVHNDADIPEGAANLSSTATKHKVTAYRNGFSIPYRADDTNDGGILRVRGTGESDCILELGTWDDSGSGETIQFNYYPTTSQVTPTYSVTVPKKSGIIALTSDIPDISTKVSKSGDTMSGNLTPATNKGAGLGTSSLLWYYNYLYRIRGCASIDSSTDGSKQITIPSKSGTMALTSDIPTNTNQLTNGAGYITSSGSCASATKATKDGNGDTISSTYLKKSGGNMSGNLGIGSNSAGGYLNGSATNGGCNSIMIGDDVWLGDVNDGGIMGMKSTGNTCGFRFLNSSGTAIGTLASAGGTLQFNGNNVIHAGNIGSYKSGSSGYADRAEGAEYVTSAYPIKWYNNGAYYNKVQTTNGMGIYVMDESGFGIKNDSGSWRACNASGYITQSSLKFKENIKNMTDDDAKKLLNIRVVSFDYKIGEGMADTTTAYNQRGCIAEEVNNIIPSVVTKREMGTDGSIQEPYGIDYSKFVPYLIKMIQIQDKRITELENQTTH